MNHYAIESPIVPTDRDFSRFRELIEREAGIYLSDAKRALLVARLTPRLRELGLGSFAAYWEHVTASDPGERVRMLDRVSTNETHFFREPHHFELIRDRVVPRWLEEARAGRRPRRVNVWSAGCSTGEEPYSLAMTLLDALPTGEGWDISITATDLSTRVLAAAENAVYRVDRADSVATAVRRRYFLRGVGSQDGNVRIAPEVRACVRFQRLNLIADPPPSMMFDLVVCRNVLIYFRADVRDLVVQRLTGQLASRGLLFLGHAETLPASSLGLRVVIPTVYQRGAR